MQWIDIFVNVITSFVTSGHKHRPLRLDWQQHHSRMEKIEHCLFFLECSNHARIANVTDAVAMHAATFILLLRGRTSRYAKGHRLICTCMSRVYCWRLIEFRFYSEVTSCRGVFIAFKVRFPEPFQLKALMRSRPQCPGKCDYTVRPLFGRNKAMRISAYRKLTAPFVQPMDSAAVDT